MSNKKHVTVLAVYENTVDFLVPAAVIQLVEEEGSNIGTSEYYLNLIIESELDLEGYFTYEFFHLTPEEVISVYATPKLIQQAFDSSIHFPEHINLFVDEEYLMELEENRS